MTLRIVLRATAGEPVLALHGWLSGAEVTEFERLAAATALRIRPESAPTSVFQPAAKPDRELVTR